MIDPLRSFRLDGKVALVTGAASGIGRAAAEALRSVGAQVRCADAKGDGDVTALDVRDEKAVEAWAASAAQLGPVSVLINSAGISRRKPALDIAIEDWDAVNAVNVTGSLLCARAAARHMVDGGSIVNIASALGVSGGIYPNVAYQASKGAVINMTRALAVEWATQKIRVNAVAPGWIETPFITKASSSPEAKQRIEAAIPMGRIGNVDEVIGAILYLASPASSYVTGHTLVVDGGFLAW
jgi:NAD(P)-dependent dehydrogenase (short-subunit alcohol dehydrogenase family)